MRLLAVKSETGSFLAPRMFVPCLEGLEHPRVPGIAKLTRTVAHRNEHREYLYTGMVKTQGERK